MISTLMLYPLYYTGINMFKQIGIILSMYISTIHSVHMGPIIVLIYSINITLCSYLKLPYSIKIV